MSFTDQISTPARRVSVSASTHTSIIDKVVAGGVQTSISRAGNSGRAYLAMELVQKGRNVIIGVRSVEEMLELRSLITLFTPEFTQKATHEELEKAALWEKVCLTIPSYPLDAHGPQRYAPFVASLCAAARRTAHSGASITLLPLDLCLLCLPPLDFFTAHELRLAKGESMDPELVLEQAVQWGYARVSMVSQPGEMALRGDILDIFCPMYPHPLRLEFFGDSLDDIRLFSPSTQRSVRDLKECLIVPVDVVVQDSTLKNEAIERWKGWEKEGRIAAVERQALQQAMENGSGKILPGAYYTQGSFIEQWLASDSVRIIPEKRELEAYFSEASLAWETRLEGMAEANLRQPKSLVLRSANEAQKMLLAGDSIFYEELVIGVASEALALPERLYHSFQDIFPLPGEQDRPWQRLMQAVREWTKAGRQILFSFSSERSRKKFISLAAQDGLTPALGYVPGRAGVFAVLSSFRSGVELPWANLLVLGEDVIQPKLERGVRPASAAFVGLDKHEGLEEGELLVHRDYGIGSFGGLHRLKLDTVANDYLLLLYAGGDKLYLPVDRLTLIQRFTAADGARPPLDRLGGAQWAAGKDKAKKAIEKIAEDLVHMYAYRQVAKGFRYGPISELYYEFEAAFAFEETPDQSKAIADVLADMEKSQPMDRLVCGDVGFGKTEVALRASFRAALEGRQIVMLCPTTVLAEQHYQTFRSRLAGFGVNVGMLSRFVTKQKQKEVLAAAAKGHVDILIGTHRLLSNDVVLPNLGLLIMDEEQRFGVRHKEKLKQLKQNVDALTLTATPIPRTLQLSLSGIRDLSVIETPPLERKPVATALMERNDAALRSIMERELEREGQIFWVHNRVQGLERIGEYIRKLVPNARVGTAHGQMGERALEETMHKFWHGELDVLLCTSIIESGLDFPRANTLIVDQAHMFGLGQLYQLRGRVGRSDRQAFAVFVVNDISRLEKEAQQRLRIIQEMDYLGAGFQLAMEDLRLRGAGNILGESQSGHMLRLGLDLFLEMLEEAVAKLKGTPLQEKIETELSLGIAAHIPEEYVLDARERLRYYRALTAARDAKEQQEVEFELRDRFGALPEEVQVFLAVLSFKRFLCKMGVLKADIMADKVRLTLGKKVGVTPEQLLPWLEKQQGKARLLPPSGIEFLLVAEQGDAAKRDFSVALTCVQEQLLQLLAPVSAA